MNNTNSINIRFASSCDIPRIMEITQKTIAYHKAFSFHQWGKDYPNTSHFQKDIDHKELYIIEYQNKCIGMATLNFSADKSYLQRPFYYRNALIIHRFAIDPDYKGKGAGRQLHLFAVALAKRCSIKSIQVDTHSQNPQVNAFFQSLGYQSRGDVSFDVRPHALFTTYEFIIDQLSIDKDTIAIPLTLEHLHVYKNLSQVYEAEFAPLTQTQPNNNGEYPIQTPCPAPDHHGWLLYRKGLPIGFAIIHELKTYFDVAEFFILPQYRALGLGQHFAYHIFQFFKGKWQIRQLVQAHKATSFWRKLLKSYNIPYAEENQLDSDWGEVIVQHFQI